MLIPIVRTVADKLNEILILDTSKISVNADKYVFFDDPKEVLKFMARFETSPKFKADIDEYKFSIYKIRISELIFILGKEPYFASFINEELPSLEEFLI